MIINRVSNLIHPMPMYEFLSKYFHFDRDSGTLMGSETGMIVAPGMRAKVRLTEAAPVTGGIAFDLLELEDATITGGASDGGRGHKHRGKRRAPAKRALTKSKKKSAKTARKVTRARRAKT